MGKILPTERNLSTPLWKDTWCIIKLVQWSAGMWKPSEDCKVTLKFHVIYVTKQIQSSLGIKAGICLVIVLLEKNTVTYFLMRQKVLLWDELQGLFWSYVFPFPGVTRLQNLEKSLYWETGDWANLAPGEFQLPVKGQLCLQGDPFQGEKTGKWGGRGNCHCWTRFYPEFMKHHLNTLWSWEVSGLKLASLMDFFGWSLF